MFKIITYQTKNSDRWNAVAVYDNELELPFLRREFQYPKEEQAAREMRGAIVDALSCVHEYKYEGREWAQNKQARLIEFKMFTCCKCDFTMFSEIVEDIE